MFSFSSVLKRAETVSFESQAGISITETIIVDTIIVSVERRNDFFAFVKTKFINGLPTD